MSLYTPWEIIDQTIQIYILFVQNIGLFLLLIRGVLYRLTFQLIFFAAGMFIAAMAGPAQFGVISLMIVNAAAFLIISSLGTDAAIVWHISGKTLSHPKTLSFALGSGFLQFFLFIMAVLIFSHFSGLSLFNRLEGIRYLIYDLIYFFGLVLTEKYISLLYGYNKAATANKAITITALIFLLILFFAYLGFILIPDVLLFYSIMTLSIGITLAVVFHIAIRDTKLDKITRPELISLLSFSAIVFLTNIIQFFAYRVDFWIIDHFNGHQALGIYAQSNRFAQLLWVIPAILAGLLTPVMRKKENPLNDKEFTQLTRFVTMINILVTLGIIIIAWVLYKYFLQRDYFPGWKSLLFMLPGYFLFAITTLLAAWFSVKRLLAVNLAGSILCFIIIAVADMILIPRYSIYGAALANTIGYSITTVYFLYQYQKTTSINLKDLLFWRKEDALVLTKLMSN